MDLVLGVSVMGDYGRMALIDAATGNVIDKYDLDVSAEDAETLVETVINTDRGLAEDGHRLVATRVSATDIVLGNDVRDELSHAGLANVTLVAPPDSAAAYVRGDAATVGQRTSALLFVSGFTATLSVVGADDAATHLIAAEPVDANSPTAALNRLLDRLAREDIGAESVYLVGATDDLAGLADQLSSPIPFRAAEQAAYAVALGAATTAAAMLTPAQAAAPVVAAKPEPIVEPEVPEVPEEVAVVEPIAEADIVEVDVDVVPLPEEVAAEPDRPVVPVVVPKAAAVPIGNWLVMPKTDAERAAISAAADAAAAEAAKPKPKPKPTPKVKTKKAAKPKKAREAAVVAPAMLVDSPVVPAAEPTEAQAKPPRMVLVGSSVAAAVAIVFVVLAAGVAIGIKPTASKQAVREYESVPGKYLPIMPGQGSAPILDQDAYVPQVVQVSGQAPTSGESTSGTTGGGYPTVASGSRPITLSPTTDVPPPPLSLPPGFGTQLRDWLPAGMNDNLSELFPAAADCTPGDSDCFVKATGCQPGDVKCLNAMYVACQTGSSACHGTLIAQPHQAPASAPSVCPGPGDSCVIPPSVCTTPNDPACEPMPLGALPGECVPGAACEQPPVVNPNERLSVPPTSAAPPPSASPTPGSDPEQSPAPPSPSTTTVESPPPSP